MSLGRFECFPQHGSYQTPSNLSSSSLQPPSPVSSDCKPQVTHPMSFIHLRTDRAACSHLSKGSGGVLEVHRSDSSIPQIPDLSQSTYLVTPWHCCEHQPHNYGSTQHLLITTSCQNSHSDPSLSQTPSILLPAGCRTMLSSPLCSSSLVLLC